MGGEARESRCPCDPDKGLSSASPAPPKSRAILWGPVEVADSEMAGSQRQEEIQSHLGGQTGTRGPQLPSVTWGGDSRAEIAHDDV